MLAEISAGSGLPETPVYLAAVPGTGVTNSIRPDRTSAPLYTSANGYFLNSAAFATPTSGQWGNAGRNSIRGPATFTMDAAVARTLRIRGNYSLDVRLQADNVLNHATFTAWNTVVQEYDVRASGVSEWDAQCSAQREVPVLMTCRSHLVLLMSSVLLGSSAALVAQQIGTNVKPADNGTYQLTVTSQLVVETVVAKDKQGHFINGLSAKDFTITEDGVPQTVRFCEHETLPIDTDALPAMKDADENITIYHHLTRTSVAPEDTQRDTGKSRYQGRRLIALYFDMTAMRPEDQQRAITAAQTFIRTQMTAVDLISIMRYQGGSVDVLQDFTSDRNRLLSILETMIVGEGQGMQDSLDDASSADTGAAFGQDDSEFNIFNTDRQLSALQTAAQMLANMNEKKSLIYFASGLRLHGIDNQAQLHATVDAAIRAGVSFWPIDARGLVAKAPLGDATTGFAGRSVDVHGSGGSGGESTTSSSRRTRCTRWPRTPAARRCSITTT